MVIRVEDLGSMDFSDVADLSVGRLPPIHPGEILREDFLEPLGLTQTRLAQEIGVPQRRIAEIIAGRMAITADTGLRLSRFFGMGDGFWVGLQADYDTALAKSALADVLSGIRRFEPAPESPLSLGRPR